MQTDDDDHAPNDHFATHDDNSTPDHYDAAQHNLAASLNNLHLRINLHNLNTQTDDIDYSTWKRKHNNVAKHIHECPVCDDGINFYIHHQYHGPDLPRPVRVEYAPGHFISTSKNGTEPADHAPSGTGTDWPRCGA